MPATHPIAESAVTRAVRNHWLQFAPEPTRCRARSFHFHYGNLVTRSHVLNAIQGDFPHILVLACLESSNARTRVRNGVVYDTVDLRRPFIVLLQAEGFHAGGHARLPEEEPRQDRDRPGARQEAV